MSVKPGATVTFAGTVAPTLKGVTARLQTRRDGVWSDANNVPLDGSGTFRTTWTAVAGVAAARLRAPATEHLVAGTSPAVALTVR